MKKLKLVCIFYIDHAVNKGIAKAFNQVINKNRSRQRPQLAGQQTAPRAVQNTADYLNWLAGNNGKNNLKNLKRCKNQPAPNTER